MNIFRTSVTRVLRLIAIVSLAISPLLLFSQQVNAQADSYPWPDAPCQWTNTNTTNCADYNWFWDENNSGGFSGNSCSSSSPSGECFDNLTYQYRNCTSFVAQTVKQTHGISLLSWGNAINWDNAATAAGYQVNGTPQVGDIAQWNTGTYGHVAYVYEVNNGVAKLSEYNKAGTGSYTDSGTVGTNGANFIHLGAPTGGVSIGTPVAIAAKTDEGGIHHVYSASSNGKIYETWWGPNTNGVHRTPLTTLNGTPVSLDAEIVNGTHHVYVALSDGKQYEIWWNSSSNGVHTTFLKSLGAKPAQIRAEYYGGTFHVYSATTTGKVYETWWIPNTDGVHLTQLSTLSGTPVSIDTNMTGSTHHVYVALSDGKQYEIWWSSGSTVHTTYLKSLSAKPAQIRAELTGSTRHIYSATTAGKVYETWWTPGNSVHLTQLSTLSGTPVSVDAEVVDGTQHVYVALSSGKLYEMWWNSSSNGVHTTFLKDLGATPTQMRAEHSGSTFHVYSGTTSGKLYETWWIPNTDGVHLTSLEP